MKKKVINDLSKIRSRLLEEASSVVKQKEENYARSLSLKFKRNAVFQEIYATFYPDQLYQT